MYTTNPTFVVQTGENGDYEIPILLGRSYSVWASKPVIDGDKAVLVAKRVNVATAGKKSMKTFKFPSPGSTSPGGDPSSQARPSRTTSGMVTVSKDATLSIKLTSIPGAYKDILPSFMPTTKHLKRDQPTTINEFLEILDSVYHYHY